MSARGRRRRGLDQDGEAAEQGADAQDAGLGDTLAAIGDHEDIVDLSWATSRCSM